jgi:hypothetical protein
MAKLEFVICFVESDLNEVKSFGCAHKELVLISLQWFEIDDLFNTFHLESQGCLEFPALEINGKYETFLTHAN